MLVLPAAVQAGEVPFQVGEQGFTVIDVNILE
jgi:hypothetical protein